MKSNFLLTILYSLLTSILLLFNMQPPAVAQGYNDNFDPARSNVTFFPSRSGPSQGVLPPPGEGGPNNVATIVPGDLPGTNAPVPTGTATTNNPGPAQGTYFPHQYVPPRPRVNLLVPGGSVAIAGHTLSRGTRVALTFQPDQLTSSQQSAIQSDPTLSASGKFSNLSTSQPYQNIVVTRDELEAMQKILFPYPQTQLPTVNFRGTPDSSITSRPVYPRTTPQAIYSDVPAKPYYPRYASSTVPLTGNNNTVDNGLSIRRFSKYLIIKGIVVACIEMICVAIFIMMGHQHAIGKAAAVAAGLMFLLASYSVWKIDKINFYTARGLNNDQTKPDSFDVDLANEPGNPPLTPQEQISGSPSYVGDNTLSQDEKLDSPGRASNPQASLPVIPAITQSQSPRSGLPLYPLGSAH